jgi:hypothetical protein
MAKIVIDIHCDKGKCGKCKRVRRDYDGECITRPEPEMFYCEVFGNALDKNNGFPRLPECLAAEIHEESDDKTFDEWAKIYDEEARAYEEGR